MRPHFRTQGVVLQKQDIGEADRVFTVFTKDFGKLRLRAVSERKITSKLRGGLELFYCSELAFVQGKTHKTITDTVLLESFPGLRGDVQSMRVMYRLAEIANEVVRGQEKDERLWDLFQETLFFLNRSPIDAAERNLVAYYFLWNLLWYTGYASSLADIAKVNSHVASTIQVFLHKDTSALAGLAKEDVEATALKQISREHLLKATEN